MSSAGQEAVELAELAGLHLDPWQRWVLDQALGERADGKWSAFEVALVVPRQNGKGGVIEALELASLFLHDVPIFHTAHLMKTSKDAFKRLNRLIQETPSLKRRVKQVRTSNEEHSIELRSGALLTFMVRSGKSGRGLSDGDLIILDEALFLDPTQMAALVPTMSTKPNPQLWYLSSAGVAVSDQLRSIRARGMKGAPGLCYMEWSVEEPEPGQELDLDDEALWAQSNPALGIRISLDYVRNERQALSAAPAEFGRERLGIFDDPGAGGRVIGKRAWDALVEVGSSVEESLVFGIDADEGHAWCAIGAAGRNAGGIDHVELIDYHAGLDWVRDRVRKLEERHQPSAWLIDPSGPAGSLVPELRVSGINLVEVTVREVAQACGGFFDAVQAPDRLRHLGQPALDLAVAFARKRVVGDGGWAWQRRDSESDISPLVAVTLAHYGLATHGGDPLDDIQ